MIKRLSSHFNCWIVNGTEWPIVLLFFIILTLNNYYIFHIYWQTQYISVVCYCACIFWNVYYLIGMLVDEVVQFQSILHWLLSYSSDGCWICEMCMCVLVYVCMCKYSPCLKCPVYYYIGHWYMWMKVLYF
jgi:hypothetical protein